MSCVTLASFSILVNFVPSEPFSTYRGLCQGDPISPYLFIILAEGLGCFLKLHVHQGLIHGLKWGVGLPPILHLQFVDDTSLMGHAHL